MASASLHYSKSSIAGETSVALQAQCQLCLQQVLPMEMLPSPLKRYVCTFIAGSHLCPYVSVDEQNDTCRLHIHAIHCNQYNNDAHKMQPAHDSSKECHMVDATYSTIKVWGQSNPT